ncbi:ethylene responsive transcription factor 1b [Trifolium pratense]|uniref:Ethylene responsive transcription factor 1b n=1 Tax=Trifolium pratense TaxID=57577 RepID=A0A2K3NVX7_TRIPR|nr:ethylene responsive transcription factor 1b [Trifolium pratense]
MGYRYVELDVDSTSVVKVINDGTTTSAMGVSLVKSIGRLLELDCDVKIKHSYRETNMCADAMANLGCSLSNEIIFFEECPSHMRNLLAADCRNFSSPRLIVV